MRCALLALLLLSSGPVVADPYYASYVVWDKDVPDPEIFRRAFALAEEMLEGPACIEFFEKTYGLKPDVFRDSPVIFKVQDMHSYLLYGCFSPYGKTGPVIILNWPLLTSRPIREIAMTIVHELAHYANLLNDGEMNIEIEKGVHEGDVAEEAVVWDERRMRRMYGHPK